MEKTLKIKGIHRSAKSRLHPDGTCNDMINLRFREQAWDMVGNKVPFASIEGLVEFKHYHDLGDGNFAIIYTGEKQVISYIDTGSEFIENIGYIYYGLMAYISYGGATKTQPLTEKNASFDFRVASINNLVMHNDETTTQYWAFIDGSYVSTNIDFGTFHCQRESMKPENNWKWANSRAYFGNNVYNKSLTWGASAYNNLAYNYSQKINSVFTLEYRTQLIQYLADAKKELESRGIPVGRCFFMSTIELFDGTEVAHTPPQFLYAGHLEIRFYEYYYSNLMHNSTMKLSGFCPDYNTDKGMEFNIEGLGDIAKGLIKGIKIYITNPTPFSVEIGEDPAVKGLFPLNEYHRPPSSADWSGFKILNDAGFVNYMLPTVDRPATTTFSSNVRRDNNAYRFFMPKYDIFPSLDEPYYHVGTISINDIVNGKGYCKFDMTEITTKPTITIDSNSRNHATFGNTPINYNGRMFFSNIKSTIDSGMSFAALNGLASPLTIGDVGAFKNTYFVPSTNSNITTYKQKEYLSFSEALPPYSSGIVNNGSWSVGMTAASLAPLTKVTPNAPIGTLCPEIYGNATRPRWYNKSFGWSFLNPANLMTSKLFYEVTIADEAGDKIFRSEVFTITGCDFDTSGNKSISLFFWPFVFPDIRATSVKFFVQPHTFQNENYNIYGSIVWFTKSFPLTKSTFHNFSFINISGNAFELKNAISPTTGSQYSEYMVVRTKDFSSQLPDISVDIFEHTGHAYPVVVDDNRIQASNLNNPYVWPAKNSYRVGNSEVIGVMSANNEVSQGQFGSYPMVAFTKSGIWALNVGVGDILISSVVPLANEVCNNHQSITAIRKGIFFATNEGLKVLQGSQVIDISDVVEGRTDNTVKSLIANDPLYDFTRFLSGVDFTLFVKNAKIGYDSFYEEIIVSNPSYAYSYVFSLENKTWSKRSDVFTHFSNQFPYLFAISGNTIYQSNKEDHENGKKAFYITNPVANDQFIKIEQIIARGVFHFLSYFNLYGSTDNANYTLVASTTTSEASYNDIKLRRCAFSFKSFILTFVAVINKDVNIGDIDILASERYNNKLR